MVIDDVGRAATVLGLAFQDYSWTKWVIDSRDHVQRVTALQRLSMVHFALPHGNACVTTVDGVIESVASWIDTAVTPVAAIPFDELAAQVAALEGDRHGASVAADDEYHGWRPAQRHLYLATMGTSPTHQRMGLGRRSLQAGLDLADREQLSAYLETSSSANVNFYSQLGFEVERHWLIANGAGPDLWLMKRAPHQ